jgi:hypothetical protein
MTLLILANERTVQAGTSPASLLAGPWTDYESTQASMVDGQNSWNAVISSSVRMGPGEVTLVTGITPVNPNLPMLTQWQGTVVYDSG